MKIKLPLFAALLAGLPCVSSAFTLDVAGYSGGGISVTPVSISVPGYGELLFQTGQSSSLAVNSAYKNDNGFGGPSINFDQNEAVKITFNGAEPVGVDFDFVGLSAGESFVVQKDLFTPNAYLVTFQGAGDGAGLYSISWKTQAVPEPASAMLGLIGASVFAFRRRR